MEKFYKGDLCEYCGEPIEEDRAIVATPICDRGTPVVFHNGLYMGDPVEVIEADGNCLLSWHLSSWPCDKKGFPYALRLERVELSDRVE